MNDIISHYRRLGATLQPPASAEAIQELEAALECRLPDELKALYADHDGAIAARPAPGAARFPMRLMPISEVIKTHKFVQEFGWAGMGLRLFWSDNNSNYAAVYVGGPLAGRVAWINHDEPDLSPVFRSLSSFLTKLLSGAVGGNGWYKLATEYPSMEEADTDADDWSTAQLLVPSFASEKDNQLRFHYAASIMALTPQAHTDSLVRFTFDDDDYVQERACLLLGKRKHEPSVDRLVELVSRKRGNASGAARRALVAIGTPYALEKLHEVDGGH